MKEYIDEAIRTMQLMKDACHLSGDHQGANGIKRCIQVLRKIPVADIVPVVRCGNCRNRYEKNWAKCQGRRPDEFCSDGVSRFKE